MSFVAYSNVVESNVSWLGMLPSHWSIARARQLFEIKKRIAGSLGHDVLSITQSGIRVKDLESNDGQISMDYAKYQIVDPGDFAMNHMDLLTGWVDISNLSGVTSPDYRVFSTRSTTNVYKKYFLYIFQMGYEQKLFYPLGQGSSQLGRWRLPSEAFNEFFLPVPPREEQAAIATFLDRETAKIDALVEEQRRLIALLKEKRQAVISRAVTRGLDPDAPMKDSGIELLGEVPLHWEVGPLKRYLENLDGQRIPLSSEERSHRPGTIPYYGASGIIDYIDEFIFDEDLILVSEDGANLINRSSPISFVARGQYWVNNHAHVLRPKDGQNSYWAERIEAIDLAPFVTGAAQPKLTADALANLKVAVPPSVVERQQIERAIDLCRSASDPLLAEAHRAIGLLMERRSALIALAVTGKIDVRSSANVLPVPIDRVRTRGLLAAEIIERSARQATFGRVKLQKIAYLAEAHVGVSELGGNYLREAAGPLDREMVRDMEREAGRLAGIRADQPEGAGTAVSYRVGDQRGTHRVELTTFLGADRSAKLDKLIDDIATIDTKGAEAVATLYAVWNDALIEGDTPTDSENVLAVLTEWHPEKKGKFRMDELHTWLGWMRRHGLVPRGTGPKTSAGRLFA